MASSPVEVTGAPLVIDGTHNRPEAISGRATLTPWRVHGAATGRRLKGLVATAMAISTVGCLSAGCESAASTSSSSTTTISPHIGPALSGAIAVTGANPATADGMASQDSAALSGEACGAGPVTITFGHGRYALSYDLPVGTSTFPDTVDVPVKITYTYSGGSYEWWSGEAVASAPGATGMVTNRAAGGSLSMTLAAVRTAVANALGVPRAAGLIHVRASWTCTPG